MYFDQFLENRNFSSQMVYIIWNTLSRPSFSDKWEKSLSWFSWYSKFSVHAWASSGKISFLILFIPSTQNDPIHKVELLELMNLNTLKIFWPGTHIPDLKQWGYGFDTLDTSNYWPFVSRIGLFLDYLLTSMKKKKKYKKTWFWLRCF